MKTYPHQEGGEIIELVRKDEHDAVVAELEQTRREFDEMKRWHERASNISLQAVAQRDKWQALAEMLATALRICRQQAKWLTNEKNYIDPSFDPCEYASEIKAQTHAALTAYDAAKSGNLPDPLAEAVRRMEAASIAEFARVVIDAKTVNGEYEAIRARLILAAKGGQQP